MEKIVEFIEEHTGFVIFTHLNPDGDALGSAFSLAAALRTAEKKAIVLLLEEPAVKYAFEEFVPLYTLDKAVVSSEDYNACISVDCADVRRLGHKVQDLFFAHPNMNLDHHISNTNFAQVNYVSNAPAAGEIIYDIMQEMQIPIDKTAQMAIYMAISTDTGNFTYQNTTPKTLRICSALVDAGLDISYVASQIYNNRSFAATKLICIFIEKLRLHVGGKMSLSTILLEDIESAGAKVEDCEILVSYAIALDTVELAAFIREIKKDTYKISLRSKHRVDVSEFASRFDGGGHKRAAGFMLKGNIHDITQTVIKTAEEFLN